MRRISLLAHGDPERRARDSYYGWACGLAYQIDCQLKAFHRIKRDNLRIRMNRRCIDGLFAVVYDCTEDEAHRAVELEMLEHLPTYYGMTVMIDEDVLAPQVEPRCPIKPRRPKS